MRVFARAGRWMSVWFHIPQENRVKQKSQTEENLPAQPPASLLPTRCVRVMSSSSGSDPTSTSDSPRPQVSLAVILRYVSVPVYTFQTFSERILNGVITNGDAELQKLKRYREDGSAKHKFITLQVAVGSQTYWFRIERAVRSNTKLSTSEISSSHVDSYDTVSLRYTYLGQYWSYSIGEAGKRRARSHPRLPQKQGKVYSRI